MSYDGNNEKVFSDYKSYWSESSVVSITAVMDIGINIAFILT